MTVHTISYVPVKGSDINIRVLDNNDNISMQVARSLHKLYDDECKKQKKPRAIFLPNITYEFSNGLIFRLFDDNDSEQNLEFYVAGDAVKKRAVLDSIPDKLQQSGINDALVLSEIRQALDSRANKDDGSIKAADQKYGVIMLGKLNGKTVMVVPYTEGRFLEGEMAFSIPKGDPKTDDRKTNANAEFKEETGIDIDLLEKAPNHPARTASNKNDIFKGAKIIKRVAVDPQYYPANKGRPTELNLDVVIVDNIAGLLPHLKGKHSDFVPAREQAKEGSLPDFPELLNMLRPYGLPQRVQTEGEFDAYIENENHRKSLRAGFDAIRSDLEGRGLISDDEGIKLDNKINPLRYFQERAVIIPIDQFEEKVRSYGETKIDRMVQAYRSSMLGDGKISGQLDAVMHAIAKVQPMIDCSNLEGGGKKKTS